MLKTNKLHKPERNAELVAMREAGQTFKDIARHFGISVHRCTSIYAIAMKKRRASRP
jgi:DNA-binding CsgD family transcriptional regulator